MSARTVYLDAIPGRVLRTLLKADPAPDSVREALQRRRKDKDEATFGQPEELGLVVAASKDGEGEPLYRITEKGRWRPTSGKCIPSR